MRTQKSIELMMRSLENHLIKALEEFQTKGAISEETKEVIIGELNKITHHKIAEESGVYLIIRDKRDYYPEGRYNTP